MENQNEDMSSSFQKANRQVTRRRRTTPQEGQDGRTTGRNHHSVGSTRPNRLPCHLWSGHYHFQCHAVFGVLRVGFEEVTLSSSPPPHTHTHTKIKKQRK